MQKKSISYSVLILIGISITYTQAAEELRIVSHLRATGNEIHWSPNSKLLYTPAPGNHFVWRVEEEVAVNPAQDKRLLQAAQSWKQKPEKKLMKISQEGLQFITHDLFRLLYKREHSLGAHDWDETFFSFDDDHQGGLPCVSPDGQQYAQVNWLINKQVHRYGYKEKVEICNTRTGAVLKTITEEQFHQEMAEPLAHLSHFFAWSTNNTFAIGCKSPDKPIAVYACDTLGENVPPVKEIYLPQVAALKAFAWALAGRFLVVESEGCTIRVCNTATERWVAEMHDVLEGCHNVGVSPDQTYLATCNKLNKIITIRSFLKKAATLEELWGSH